MPTDKEREILKLMYDLHLEHLHHQGQMIIALRQTLDGVAKAVEGAERSHEIAVRIMKATGELMGVH